MDWLATLSERSRGGLAAVVAGTAVRVEGPALLRSLGGDGNGTKTGPAYSVNQEGVGPRRRGRWTGGTSLGKAPVRPEVLTAARGSAPRPSRVPSSDEEVPPADAAYASTQVWACVRGSPERTPGWRGRGSSGL
ncbi:hypothetical protein GCM10010299_20670 [Streptomyces tanashiensis]|nr:hypothetical protein GCM10010299_20670 [Streptomyces tanashiensis]